MKIPKNCETKFHKIKKNVGNFHKKFQLKKNSGKKWLWILKSCGVKKIHKITRKFKKIVRKIPKNNFKKLWEKFPKKCWKKVTKSEKNSKKNVQNN